MNKTILKFVASIVAAATLTGCVGSNAVTGGLMKMNVKAVDNRYARGGLNMLLAPVYGITIALDYVVFNSLEFWTGTNPINGKTHVFDTKTDTVIDVNQHVDDSLKTAPVKPIAHNRVIEHGEMQQIDANTVAMDITYNNGEQATLVGVRNGDNVTYYLDGEVVSQTSLAEMEQYVAERS